MKKNIVITILLVCVLSTCFLFACGKAEEEQGPDGVFPYEKTLPWFFADEREASEAFGEAFRPVFPDLSALEGDAWFVGFACEYRVDASVAECESEWNRLSHSRVYKTPECYYVMNRFDLDSGLSAAGVEAADFENAAIYDGKIEDFSVFYKETEAMTSARICNATSYFPLSDGKSCVFLFSAPKRIYRDSAEYVYNGRYRIAYEGENLVLSSYSTEEEARDAYPQYWRSDQTFRSFLPVLQHGDTGRVSQAFCRTGTFTNNDVRVRAGIMQNSKADYSGDTYDRLYAAYINFEIGDNEYWSLLPFYAVKGAPAINEPMNPAQDDGNFALLEPVAAKVQTYLFDTFWKGKLPTA